MKDVLSDIFTRCLAVIQTGKYNCLSIQNITPIEDNQTLNAPVGTALILGSDDQKKEPLAIIAITSPKLTTDHPGLLALVVRRAQAYKASYFITWTLRDAALWKTPRLGTPTERSYIEKLRDYEDNYEISRDAENQIFCEPVRLRILNIGQNLISDLENLFKNQALELVRIDATYFVQRIIDSVHELLPIVTDSLHMRFSADLDFRSKFTQWAVSHNIAGSPADRDFSLSIARQIIYRLLGKILFYQSLRRVARQLPALDLTGIDSSQILSTLRRDFAEALKIDYHAVFAEDVPDTITWPTEATKRLAALIHDFNTRDFSNLPQDVVGTVFERLIPPEERHLLGQYFTSEPLCDLGITFCVLSPHSLVADVTCGTGTFLIRAYDRKRWLGNHDHAAQLAELWGIDIAPFPAELAVINLFRQNLTAASNFPRIVCQDIFAIKPGDKLPFPPLKMNIANPEQVDEPIPQFDAIIGNFPYVGANQIEQKDKNYLNFIRYTLIEAWLEKYPELFYYPSKHEQTLFESSIADGKHNDSNRNRLKLRISTYADLYVYIFFQAARFLKSGGRMGIITSNAWIDVNYGYELQKFLCNQFKIVAILESRCEPWFTEASVNTVFTIVERCEDQKARDMNLVKFVKVKKQLAELVPADPEIEPLSRWKHLRKLTEGIENAGHKYARTVPLGVITEEDENFRIRVCRQGELHEELQHESKTVKWGKYLRAPEIFLNLIKNGYFCLLRDIAVPMRGGTTRINEFFHTTPQVAESFAIETEYLLPLIKSPKDSIRILIDVEELELRIFVCRRSKEKLKELGHKGALKYVEWGEKQTYSRGEFKGLNWPDGTWLVNRQPGWYALPSTETNSGQVFFSQSIGERHMHRYCNKQIIPDCTHYYFVPNKDIEDKILSALLNSSVCALSSEIFGRVTLGDGVLSIKVEDARDYLLVPDLRKSTFEQKKRLTDAFDALCTR
ncbi:MAG: hypothetical protein A2161_21335, partial [Candidatus Schekmanbacteria bacterium RBG_13_48_7]